MSPVVRIMNVCVGRTCQQVSVYDLSLTYETRVRLRNEQYWYGRENIRPLVFGIEVAFPEAVSSAAEDFGKRCATDEYATIVKAVDKINVSRDGCRAWQCERSEFSVSVR